MKDSVAPVYAVVTPMMNTFIYSLRMKAMHWGTGKTPLRKSLPRG